MAALFVEKLRRYLPTGIFRSLTVTYNTCLSVLPYGVKYPVLGILRRHKAPYKWLETGDIVIQVGAPRDILEAGRSRAVHFARIVKQGKVIVSEPDPVSAAELVRFADRHRLSTRVVVFCQGAWSCETELTLLASSEHPAANLVKPVNHSGQCGPTQPRYTEIPIKVNTLDAMHRQVTQNPPKLVSITTNGSELEILKGMADIIALGCPYISLIFCAEEFPKFANIMRSIGYEYAERDDRGYSFRRNRSAPSP
ncbi:MAG: FkbM family methyltransferase, partial [Gammaproteobacteria bacterium]|nr:FkbM family methyltransferase [Gammaproteobacteria bacterium]